DTHTNQFCGFCAKGNVLGTGNFLIPARACSNNADCAGFAGFPFCRQRTAGAFGTDNNLLNTVRTITETGTPSGDLTSGTPKKGIVVSIFCIPPTGNAVIDTAAALPGPGAVALQGNSQLLY